MTSPWRRLLLFFTSDASRFRNGAIFIQPLGFLIFTTAAFAETNRLPFDLPEGESEIVAGYHLEYGSMKFAIFQMAEYGNMTTASGVDRDALFRRLALSGAAFLPAISPGHIPAMAALSGEAMEWVACGMPGRVLLCENLFLHVVLRLGALDDSALPL